MRRVLDVPLGRRILLRGLAGTLMVARTKFGSPLSVDDGKTTVRLGDSSVDLVTTERKPRGLTFVSVHENEQTGVAAARRLIEHRGGRLIELKAQRQRLISFGLKGSRYTFDPNRIFTDVGVDKSLRRYSHYSRAAQDAVTKLREALVANLRKDFTLIAAVHNNTDGNLSVESYSRGASLQNEAAQVAINPKLDPDDFFLVLDAAIFKRLQAAGFNVVLQSANPTDDGSMSVFCQHSGIPYVNVESEYGHLGEQSRMLQALFEIVCGRQ